MAKIINRIDFTEEEKECLKRAAEILKNVSDELSNSSVVEVDEYENCEYITDILHIYFEY